MKTIFFHIDVNSAFLSWSAVHKLQEGSTVDLRTIPSIIGGDIAHRHGVVLAKSMPAKAFHITTGEAIMTALKKCPTLHIEPPTHSLYEEYSEQLMHFLSDFCPDIEKLSIDECFMDFTSVQYRYSSPEAAANFIRESVFDKFGFTVNIGISDKKVLAKMASDFKKPNLVHTLYYSEIQKKMWPLPISNLYMCGKSSVETLYKLGILTIGDLASSDAEIIALHLKSHGTLLWEYANGIDDSAIEVHKAEPKGIGNSTTLSKDVDSKEEAYTVLLALSETVGMRLRNEKKFAFMISTEIKYNTFQSVSHQMTLQVPCNSTDSIYKNACLLFDEMWNHTPVRLLGIRTSKLVTDSEPIQLSLFESADSTIPTKKQQDLEEALDKIRRKFGDSSIVRGSLLSAKTADKHTKQEN